MKVWLTAGIILAIGGWLLIWNGFQTRFVDMPQLAMHTRIDVPPQHSATPAIAVSDSSYSTSHLQSDADSARLTDMTIRPAMVSENAIIEPKITRPQLSAEVSLPTPISHKEDSDWRDRHKSLIMKRLAECGWSGRDLELMRELLRDERAQFLPNVLKTNFTHTETPDIYTQHISSAAVARCLEFWNQEGSRMQSAINGDGVPPEVITAILKVETNFGTHRGKESVLNVFWTLALGDIPEVRDEVLPKSDPEWSEKKAKMTRRAEWARSQLSDLLNMMRSGHGADPLKMVGSWAGAFGLPQFIPTSYLVYGRDGNGDGIVDLDDVSDAAASIAYYLRKNGWPDDGSYNRERQAILSYNHSEPYADCVLALADSLTNRGMGLRQ